jgi:putative sterol carrier protein
VIKVATKEVVLQAMHKMAGKTEDPKIRKHFEGFDKTLVMVFEDIGLDVSMVFQNGQVSVMEGSTENPDLTVTTDSETILGILNGTVSATRAAMGGRIKTKGPVRDLLKLQRLMKA